jgi:FMN hydrolase / 5-amino-6-(5-phospho-D-ribitylamino)uracil phosphatase
MSTASDCRAILFDVMGTLVYDPFFVEVPRALGMSLRELLRDKHPRAWIDFELGQIDEAQLEARFFLDGRSYPHAAMKQAMIEAYTWLDGVEAIVRELVEAGHELHLLSNYTDWYKLIEAKLQLSRYAAWSFVSCDVGVRKPDPEAYLGPARKLGCEPSQLLFVDDRASNCEAAVAQGLDAILFEDAASLRRALQERGLIPQPRDR